MRRWRAGTVWLAMWATDGFFFHLNSTVFNVYLILQVGLDPLQLVLMGTILEVSYLLFEIPTGIVADTISRKWSIVIGFLGSGIAFVLLSFADSFAVAALSQVLYGVSATFISGADVAWLTDEVGEETARPLYLRSEQFFNGGALVGIVASVVLASIALQLPILICGVGYAGLGIALVFLMTESRRPTRETGTKLRHSMRDTFTSAVREVRAHHVLLLILATAALHGASTEGWDRLSDLQFLQGIGLPPLGDLNRVVWFGILDGVGLVLGIGALSYVKRRGHLEGHVHVARILAIIDVMLIASVVGFAWIGSFWWAVLLFWIVEASGACAVRLHRMDQPGPGPLDASDHQLDGGTGRRHRSGARGAGRGRRRPRGLRPVGHLAGRPAPGPDPVPVSARDPAWLGGNTASRSHGSGDRPRGRAALDRSSRDRGHLDRVHVGHRCTPPPLVADPADDLARTLRPLRDRGHEIVGLEERGARRGRPYRPRHGRRAKEHLGSGHPWRAPRGAEPRRPRRPVRPPRAGSRATRSRPIAPVRDGSSTPTVRRSSARPATNSTVPPSSRTPSFPGLLVSYPMPLPPNPCFASQRPG